MRQLSIARELADKWDERKALVDLRTAEPPVSLRRARITVCRPVYFDCERFVEHVNRVLGLDLAVRYSPVSE